MSGDDLQKLNIGDTIELRPTNGIIRAYDLVHNDVNMEVGDDCKVIVRGIDTWSKLVRVEFDEFNCHWVVPRLIKNEGEMNDNQIPNGKIKVIRRLDNGEEIEWDCFWDNGWWSYGGGVRVPGVVAWFHPMTGKKINSTK